MPGPHRRWQSDLPLAAQRREDAPLLRELGRLREIAFRAVGEGSGKRRDIDGYDDDYLHLILWDEEDLEIVGAYRFMPTAIQLAKRGTEDLQLQSVPLRRADGRCPAARH